ncbi:MAG TPA: CoA transferase [Streptosporangiaceae bacterium]|jgi:crotonobetainyl-CoA:carnitine CoA-transferase CaiB-like acyl-CoA transferase
MEQGPLHGVRVIEDGSAIGISVAGLLLAELGAAVTRIGPAPDLAGPGRIVHRAKAAAEAGQPLPGADVMLLGADSRLAATAPVVVRFLGRPAEDDGLAPAGTMLAEARSGLMRLQLGHRDGPFCLASPIAGLGAGILGALSAASGLLSRARGVTAPWESTVSDRDGTLVMQTLSASFIDALPAANGPAAEAPAAVPTSGRPRYRDPYTVSFSPVMRFHRARDGWVFVAAVSRHMWHTLFGLMGRPDLAEDRELDAALPFNIADQAQGEALAALVAEFVAGLSVDECVDLCVRNKIVAAPVLNGPTFLAHPQAVANGLPVEVHDALGRQLQVGRFVQCAATAADAAPLGTLDGAGAGPLHGVRVIDVSRAAAGPICGRVLADLGAEVVRVEDPDGEHSRQVGLTFAGNNRNKLSLGLDLTKPEGLDALARITEQSDVVLTNALPAASARLGIDPATVAARNPATIHISILGFGRRPPFGGRRVVDAAAQALSGQALAEGGGREPVGCTGGFLDNGTGWLAALGCVATLYQRQAAGHAGSVEACLLNTSAFVQLFGLTDPPPPGGHLDEDRWGYAADQRLYQARDGWICVAAASPAARQAFGAALGLAGCPDAGREVHGLTATAFAEALAELDLAAVADLFGRAGFADWTTVRTLEQAARADDDDFIRVAQEPWGFLRQPRLLPRYAGDERPPVTGAAAAPGRDDAGVLGRYGLAARHDALIESGAMRSEPGPVTLQASSV